MMMSNKTYDILKWITQIFLPAFTTFLGVVLQCFHYQNTEIVITILVAFDTFMGALLGISSANYKNVSRETSEEEQ